MEGKMYIERYKKEKTSVNFLRPLQSSEWAMVLHQRRLVKSSYIFCSLFE